MERDPNDIVKEHVPNVLDHVGGNIRHDYPDALIGVFQWDEQWVQQNI
jgi:hypothetical protein